jgi:hypothetical protein
VLLGEGEPVLHPARIASSGTAMSTAIDVRMQTVCARRVTAA